MTDAIVTRPSLESANKLEVPDTGMGETRRTDQNERFSLKVKPGYVLKERPSSLPPLPPVEESQEKDESSSKGKKRKKERRKRPRDPVIDRKFCNAMLRGEACPYGDDCRFSHDVKELIATRPPDIAEWKGGCPHFNLHGSCPFGPACRVGSAHLSVVTGESIRKEPESPPPLPVLNTLSRDVQTQLRKKLYPFKCKRYNEKKDQSADNGPIAAESGTPTDEAKTSNADVIDMSPLPGKMKKIIDFSNKVYVAPLTTVGNLPFRRVMKRLGADITCGEMALAANLLSGQASEWALLKRHPEEDIFGVQIAAGFPDMFTRTAELVESQTTIDFLDLNLGCPLDLVVDKGSGAALMMRDKRLKAALMGMTPVLSCPITIKMRTGWDMAKPFAHELVPKIQSWGIDGISAIMIHGRSRLQRYSREADWNYIQKVAKSQSPDLPQIPLIGNGDIFSYTDYEENTSREGISSCAMLGRGALVKPWLPTEIKEKRHWDISASERLDILKDFVRFGLEHWGSDQKGVNNCRRFLLEWLSFLHRYVPVGLLEVLPQHMNQRLPRHICGRNDLETLFLSSESSDWIKISEMLLGPVPDGFRFEPKHKAKSYSTEG